MDFSKALEYLKKGRRVTKASWNNHNMFIAMMEGYPSGVKIGSKTAESLGLPEGRVVKYNPYLVIRTFNGSVSPWLPNTNELFSKDWELVKDASRGITLSQLLTKGSYSEIVEVVRKEMMDFHKDSPAVGYIRDSKIHLSSEKSHRMTFVITHPRVGNFTYTIDNEVIYSELVRRGSNSESM